MTDDISEIVTNASCYTINSQTSIYSYSGNVRRTYTQIGGKWLQTAQTTYSNIPTTSYCVSYDTISSLNSYSYMQPIFEFIALIMALFVWFFCFKLWSKLIWWRGGRL